LGFGEMVRKKVKCVKLKREKMMLIMGVDVVNEKFSSISNP
jgi:hypothetical protein